MSGSLMAQGLQLMLVGMGTVFVFLTALVFATTLMSRLVTRGDPGQAPDDGGPSDDEIAAISAAIALHRSRR